MATIKEIAERAHVSAATVSRVLNRDETLVVSSEVKSTIFKIAHEFNYVPPRMRHVQQEKEIVIGIADWHIIRKDRPNIQMDSLTVITNNLLSKAPVRFIRMEYSNKVKVNGVIAFGMFTEQEMEYLREQSYYIVFVNSDEKNYEYDSIVMDYASGLTHMMNYLVDQKQYQSIGYIGGVYKDSLVEIGTRRKDTLKEILKERKLYQEEYFKVGEISRESGCQLAEEMLRQGTIPEVVILGNDEIAEGAIEVFRNQKIRIPKDIAVVIYKDIETMESKYPTYTTLRMLPKIVWMTAVKRILERIIEKQSDTMKIYLPTKLEVGDST